MVDFEIKKKQKILEVNNDMAHNYYYLIYGKLLNTEKTRCRKFKMVIWCDLFDVQEYFEKDFATNDEIKQYILECAIAQVENVKDYNDTESLREFYDFCNESINSYNQLIEKM